jgi:predicted regulator of Ras-like GTPase activity (Roadblock/LC7/MglB family)
MLESVLQGLREVEGVHGAMVVDPTAAVIAYHAHAIYDLPVLQQVARSVVSAADSVQLIQDDWDVLTAQFGEGRLLLRALRTTAAARPQRYILAVLADSTLNSAFLGVALRVAAAKLTAELEAAPAAHRPPSASGPITGTVRARTTAELSRPELSNSGVGWPAISSDSGLSWSGATPGSGVGGSSDVSIIDTEASTFLSACTKALSASVGPMAKVFVKEAVRRICGDRPFSRADGQAVLAELDNTIEDSDDRAMFRRATRAL